MNEAGIVIILKNGVVKVEAKLMGLNQNDLGLLILNLDCLSDDLKKKYYK